MHEWHGSPMNDISVTQGGLAIVYAAVGLLLTLTERVERSKALRLWTVMFFLFSLDASGRSAAAVFALPAWTRAVEWVTLLGAGVAGVAGTIAFTGKPLPKGLFLLGGVSLLMVLIGSVFDLNQTLIHSLVDQCVAAAFLWSARVTFNGEISPCVGRSLVGSACIGVGIYAMLWPLLCRLPGFSSLEFFIKLSLLVWAAGGGLLLHFERSRERIRQMAAKELELRAQLERSERLEALGRLAGGVAHDFNNVLTTVIHGSELVLRQLADRPTTAAHVELVLEAARGAAGFTRQLLALGRRHLPGRRPILVNEALRGAMCIVRPSLLPNHTLLCPPAAADVAIAAGEGQLEQVIVNLSLNALDAMPHGGTLELLVEAEREVVRLIVHDTGCGMDEGTLKRVFEPFFSTKGRKGGTGLGLAAVYAIVQQNEGQIAVMSTPGKGARFTVEFPRCEADQRPLQGRSRSKLVPSAIRILLVDDEESVLRSLCAGLAKSDFQVTTASCADDAIKRAAEVPPTLLIADACMPGRGGLELVADLRRTHPGLPVIMMTGRANDEWGSSKCGVQWLLKPFSTQHLQEAIESALTD
jgi:signal transduction histidine kinase/CheY-like chemotaxis protein